MPHDNDIDTKHSKENIKAMREAERAASKQSAAAAITPATATSAVPSPLSYGQGTTDGKSMINLDGYECAVCLESNNPMKLITTCSHSLCASCAPKCTICPTCRKPFTQAALVDNFELNHSYQLIGAIKKMDLIRRFEEQQAETKALTEKLAQAQQFIMQQRAQLEVAQQELKGEREKFNKKAAADAASRQARKKENIALKNENDKLAAEVKNLEGKLKNLQITNKKLEKDQVEKIRKWNAQEASLKSTVRSLQNQLAEAQKTLSHSQDSIVKLLTEKLRIAEEELQKFKSTQKVVQDMNVVNSMLDSAFVNSAVDVMYRDELTRKQAIDDDEASNARYVNMDYLKYPEFSNDQALTLKAGLLESSRQAAGTATATGAPPQSMMMFNSKREYENSLINDGTQATVASATAAATFPIASASSSSIGNHQPG